MVSSLYWQAGESTMGFSDYNKRQCPRCHCEFYPGDCDIVATRTVVDAKGNIKKQEGDILMPAPSGSMKRALGHFHTYTSIDNKWEEFLPKRKCPCCEYFLPPNIDRVRGFNVAVVGNFNSGKSHYIAQLIQHLQQGLVVGPSNYASFVTMTEEVEKKYTTDYFEPLQKNQKIDNTPRMRLGEIIEPLIYQFSVSTSNEELPKSMNLVIHDASGEDYKTQGKVVDFTRHVLNAQAIIYLADPLDMPKMRDNILSSLASAPPKVESPSSMLNAIGFMIEQKKHLPAGTGLSTIPVAVTLSKSDLLKKLQPVSVNQSHSIFTNPSYGGGINFQDLDKVNQEVYDILYNYGDHSLLQAVSGSHNARYFAVSATGWPPDPVTKLYPKIEPLRCLDPFLWILHELGIIPSEW